MAASPTPTAPGRSTRPRQSNRRARQTGNVDLPYALRNVVDATRSRCTPAPPARPATRAGPCSRRAGCPSPRNGDHLGRRPHPAKPRRHQPGPGGAHRAANRSPATNKASGRRTWTLPVTPASRRCRPRIATRLRRRWRRRLRPNPNLNPRPARSRPLSSTPRLATLPAMPLPVSVSDP